MPNTLALDWESHQIAGLDVETGGGRPVVQRAFRLAWPSELSPDTDAERAGEWLKVQLDKFEIGGRDVIVSIPREDAVVRHLELPDVPDDELPEIVRLQAATRSTLELDQFLLDFMPMPRRPDREGRDVLMATIPTTLADRIKSTFAAAGLEVKAIGLCPAASAELVAHVERDAGHDPAELSLIVGRHGKRVEISMMMQQRLVFSHSTQIQGDDADADNRSVVAEINRSRFSLQELLGGAAIARAAVLGTDRETKGLCAVLQERLQCQVQPLDPLEFSGIDASGASTPEEHAAFAGPVGMLLGRDSSLVESVDFLSPRKTIVRTDPRRIQMILGIAAGVLIVVGGLIAQRLKISSLDSTITTRERELKELQSTVRNGRPTIAAAGLLQDWHDHHNDWLDRLNSLTKIMGGTERLYFDELKFDPAIGNMRGKIIAHGVAKERDDIQELERVLVDEGYVVVPQQIRKRPGSSKYPLEMNLDLSLPVDVEDESDGEDSNDDTETGG